MIVKPFVKIILMFIGLYDNLVKQLKIKFYKSKGVKIGRNFKFSKDSYIDIHRPDLIEIGDNVQLTKWAMILCYDSVKDKEPFKKMLNKSPYGKVKIGNNVYIGAHSIIMPNVSIGDNVIIAANTVVTKDVESNRIVAGSPAKVLSILETIN
jgi:maltose O-acetyltransferase